MRSPVPADKDTIAAAWLASPEVQQLVTDIGMDEYKRLQDQVYEDLRSYHLAQTTAGLITGSVSDWPALRSVANDRSRPLNYRATIQTILTALGSENATDLCAALPILIQAAATLNDMPVVPDPA